jgi:ATP-dependent protease ClpP protease subunit
MGEINTASAGQLLTIVNAQVRSGIHKIRIVMSSGGGDSSAAFAAYNYLRSLPNVEVTTFNVGNVDSAAMILYCAGRYRYSFPATRFLIHGNSLTVSGNVTMDPASLQGNLELLKSLNQMVIHVISSTANKGRQEDIENAVHGQVILTPEEAIKWGLVQEIKSNFMEPGAILVTVGGPLAPEAKPPIQFTSTTPVARSRSEIKH